MPVRSLSQSSFFDPRFVCPNCLEPGTLEWLLGTPRRELFPGWLLKGWRGEKTLGRDAWPAVVLLTLLLLRWSETGMSRRASIRRARTDAAWRAAMGLAFGDSTPSRRTVGDFEVWLMRRHPDVGVPRVQVLLGHLARLCMVRAWSRATGRSVATLANELGVGWVTAPSTKGWFGIDWRDGSARDSVLTRLVAGAFRVVEAVRDGMNAVKRGRVARLRRHCWTLLRVFEDDLDETPDGGFTVARRVAANRIVSITDIEARQSRKTRSRPFKGYKLHVLGDAVSGLIASVCVASANVHDSKVCPRLARRAKTLRRDLDRLFGDTAYGGSRNRFLLSGMGIGVIAPVQLVPERLDRLDKADFTVDFDNHMAMCPAGEMATSARVVPSTHRRRFFWSISVCRACPMRAACLPNPKRGRRLELEPYEQQLQEARTLWDAPEYRLLYRRRAAGERLINSSVRHGARRAASWGLRAANLQAHLIACVVDLKLLAVAKAA